MIDRHIEAVEQTKQEAASEHHWDELNSKGETTFVSDQEDRTISMDDITADCLIDLAHEYGGKGLHAQTQGGLSFIYTLRHRIVLMKNTQMDDALEDYYK